MPTRSDVAKLAGVSPSTVSRVLNDNGYVASEVRKRVLEVIKELNYVPNRAARSLRLQQYQQIACIAPSVGNSFYHEIVAGIEETALEAGYTFSWYNLRREQMGHLQVILEGFYDGIIFLAPYEIGSVFDLERISKRLPTCLYSDRGKFYSIPNVYVDLRAAMRVNIEYLIECGHRQILFLGPEYRDVNENPRFQGYLDAFRNQGLEFCQDLIQLIPNHKDTISYGYERVKQIIEQGMQFTAVAASNDLVAVGALKALQDQGISVPKDISITGVDDVEIASLITPALTTTRIPKRKIGNRLMELLLKQILGEPISEMSVGFLTEFVTRESVMARVPNELLS